MHRAGLSLTCVAVVLFSGSVPLIAGQSQPKATVVIHCGPAHRCDVETGTTNIPGRGPCQRDSRSG